MQQQLILGSPGSFESASMVRRSWKYGKSEEEEPVNLSTKLQLYLKEVLPLQP